MWPPSNDGYCCSSAGYLGNTPGHCSSEQGGLDARTSGCCTLTDGHLACEIECDDPPTECTGVPAIDAVLKKSKIGCKIGLGKANTLYTWQGFCDAVRQFNGIADTTRRLYLGDASLAGAAHGLVNIAGLLAQCMWESGGEVPFSAW